jgi:hypothetical protein
VGAIVGSEIEQHESRPAPLGTVVFTEFRANSAQKRSYAEKMLVKRSAVNRFYPPQLSRIEDWLLAQKCRTLYHREPAKTLNRSVTTMRREAGISRICLNGQQFRAGTRHSYNDRARADSSHETPFASIVIRRTCPRKTEALRLVLQHYEAPTDRLRDRLSPAGDGKLREDRCDVRFNCVLRDAEPVGD